MLYDVAVIGGGAAGMMAAIFAASNGAKTILIEKNDRLGLKVLATGNGRCNVTNRQISKDRYHGSVSTIFDSVFSNFTETDLESFFSNRGLKLTEENLGRMFPVTQKAISVASSLEKELTALGVTVLKSTLVRDVTKEQNFEILLEESSLSAKAVILTTGGKAAHRLGSSGDGLFWATKLGHKPTDLYAALVPIELATDVLVPAMGVKVAAKAIALVDDTEVRSKTGDLLLTHFGVSGPAAMGIAGALAPYIGKQKTDIALDLVPDKSESELHEVLIEFFQRDPKKSLSNVLTELFPKKLSDVVLEIAGVSGRKKTSEVSRIERNKLVSILKYLKLPVSKVRPLREAQVTSGGISASEVNASLASTVVPGLYFAGEILDIDGDSGGFNLQWAWSSGATAGTSAAIFTDQGQVKGVK